MSRTFITVEEVAVMCDVSVQTINNWYKFKRENPNNEFAQLLPDYQTVGTRHQRFWDKSDISALRLFQSRMPTGCKGVMGSVTQRYVKKYPTETE